MPLDVVLGAALLVAEALAWFGATSEAALDHFSRTRLLEGTPEEERAALGARLDRVPTLQLTAQLVRYLGNATLVVGLGYVVFRAAAAADAGPPIGTAAAVILGAFSLTFLVNNVLARVVAGREPERIVRRALPALGVLAILTAPLRAPLRGAVRLLFRVRLEDPPATAREEVRESLEEGEREGTFSAAEAEMIESIIDMKTSRVEDVMTPRGETVTVAETASLDEAVALVNEEGYSRIPVHRSDRDDIVGVLYARDLLQQWTTIADGAASRPTVGQLMREAYFVPEGKLVADLMQEMKARKVHLAVVVDEHTRVAGIVTIEDLLEVIVGDIQDEYDEDEETSLPSAEEIASGSLEVEGRTPIEDVNRALDVQLPVTDDYETMGGLVFHELGKVPAVGERLHVGTVLLTVLEADERTVLRLQVARDA
jgi:CBS domain containing-hemolysin-like protein